MEQSLSALRAELLARLDDDPARAPLGGVGVFHCRAPQALRAVPFHLPTLILVVAGSKAAMIGNRPVTCRAGELLLVPAGSALELGNRPEPAGRVYLGIAVAFSAAAVEQFRRHYAAPLQAWENPPQWHARAPAALLEGLRQWVSWCDRHGADPLVASHRQVEFLLHAAQAGVAGNLLLAAAPDWRQRVAQLLALDLARPWQAGEVATRLAVGESSLRRHLAAEGSGFRELLEEARLVAGLGLLQETFWPVGQVAEAVGYRSPSRFGERFKLRFGLTPQELRRTRERRSAGS